MKPPASSPPPRRGISFRTRLVIGVCSLVLLTGITVLWLAHRSAREGTQTLTDEVFRQASGRAATRSREFVLRAAPVVETLSRLANHGLEVDDQDRLAPQLLAVLQANPGLSWVSYGDEAGTFTGAYRTPDGGCRLNRSRITAGKTRLVEHDVLADGNLKEFRTEADTGYDPRTRPFYTKAKQAGRLVWLPPYVFFKQGIPGVSCALPVKGADGQLRGVLTVDFDLNALTGFVSSLTVSEHSTAFLFTEDGVLLTRPTHLGPTSPATTATELPTLADTGDPLLNAYRSALGPKPPQPTDDNGFRLFTFRHAGNEYLGSASAFRVGDDLVWVVGVAAPASDFAGDVWQTQAMAMAAAALAVLAAVGLAFLLASAVSQPVRSLIGFMQRVGGGDLEAKAEFGGSGEFRELAEELNQMIADLRDRARLLHSLDLAMQVQQQLLPRKAPTASGLDVAGHSTYCDETGGDYYDFLTLGETAGGGLMIALGDVMGHGVAAALVMAGVRAVLRDRAATGSLAELMGRLNEMLAADLDGARFMTMFLAVVDSRAGRFRWASAGHDPAFVYDPAEDRFVEDESGGLPLGVMPGTEYEEYSFGPLRAGQVIVVGTDGVWEMPNPAGEQFGKDRLREIIRANASGPASGVSKAVLDALTVFRETAPPADDVTFVVVKVQPDWPPAATAESPA